MYLSPWCTGKNSRLVVILMSVAWASPDMSSRCLLQKKSQHASAVSLARDRQVREDPAGSWLSAEKLKPFVRYESSDFSLQAPPEGGPFSDFFNQRVQGHGINKWLQYFPAYHRHLGKFIGKEVHIVEIGIFSGGSLDMWKSVFGPNAHVYGCDIDPRTKSYVDSQTQIFIGDQANPEFWKNVIQQVPRIDILIDDGGHTPEQQIATLGLMLPHLSPDGVFITEDVHEQSNPFWKSLKFAEDLESPRGKRYPALSGLVSSVHVYPFLLVVERDGNRDGDAMLRQLSTQEQPIETRAAVAGESSQEVSLQMLHSLQGPFPWLSWGNETRTAQMDDSLVALTTGMQMPSLLFVRDGKSDFSFDAPWDAQSDAFMSRILSDFKLLHEGICCDWHSNVMQNNIDSLHIYPHLLILKSTIGRERLVKSVKHGTVWIPHAR